jgi:multidrug transporter EmrE-like cation transporter
LIVGVVFFKEHLSVPRAIFALMILT